MPASDHLNPMQLQLFLDPQEHAASIHRSTDPFQGSMAQFLNFKELQAKAPAKNKYIVHGAGIYDSLSGGRQVREPIRVNISTRPEDQDDPLEQGEGHHRLMAAAARQREDKAKARTEGRPEVQTQFVPVEYAESRYVGRKA